MDVAVQCIMVAWGMKTTSRQYGVQNHWIVEASFVAGENLGAAPERE